VSLLLRASTGRVLHALLAAGLGEAKVEDLGEAKAAGDRSCSACALHALWAPAGDRLDGMALTELLNPLGSIVT